MDCEIFLHALESVKISQMMTSSYVVRNLCGYFVITCWKHTADKQINQQDFNTARARTITSFQVPPQHCLFQIQPGISWVRKYSFHPNLETSEYPIYSSFFLSLSHNITDSKKCLDNSNKLSRHFVSWYLCGDLWGSSYADKEQITLYGSNLAVASPGLYFFDGSENRGLFLLYVGFKKQYLTVVLSYTCRTFFWWSQPGG